MAKKYKISKYRIFQILVDSVLICLSLYLAYVLTEQTFWLAPFHRIWFIKACVFMLLIRLAVNILFGLYRQIWRYISFDDFIKIFKAVVSGSLIGVIAIFFLQRQVANRTMFLVDMLLCFTFLSGARIVRRYFRQKMLSGRPKFIKKKRVLLYGAGSGGDIFVRQVRHDPYSKIIIAGFVDDDPEKTGAYLHGVEVLGSGHNLEELIDKNEIDEIIITIPSVKKQTVDSIYSIVKRRNVAVKIMPSIYEVLNEGKKITNVRMVDVSDLLGRNVVSLDLEGLKSNINGKRVLITGAAGSIGKVLFKQVLSFHPEKVVGLDINENGIFWLDHELSARDDTKDKHAVVICDIRNKNKVESVIDREKPHFIFHAAAYKHVPLSGLNPSEYVLTNILGTRNLIDIVKKKPYIEKFCFISTDKAVKPCNVMGATKAVGERIILEEIVKNKDKRFSFVRFGNVLGSRGNVIPIFKEMIEQGGPIKVTHPDVERYFMDTQEAVNLVLEASFIPAENNAFLLNMGKPIKIVDLAKLLIKLAGLSEYNIEIEYCGLRPGEKLRENLYDNNFEKLAPTAHNKVYSIIGKNKENTAFNYIDESWIRDLIESAKRNDDEDVLKKLKEMFPVVSNRGD